MIKLTKDQLRQMIKEALSTDDADVQFIDEKQSINMKDVEMKEEIIMKHLTAMFDELGREELPKRFSEKSLLKPIIDRYISARRNVREPYFDKLTGRMKNK